MSTIASQIEDIFTTIISDGDGEVFADDVNQVLDILGFTQEEERLRINTKVINVMEEIVECRAAADMFLDDPKRAFNKYRDERYSPDGASFQHEAYKRQADDLFKFLCGLAALGSHKVA